MTRAGRIIAGAALALSAGAALADGMTVDNLGPVKDVAACLDAGRSAFAAYGRDAGFEPIVTEGAWSITGWDLSPGTVDVTILCAAVTGGYHAMIAGHSVTEDGGRQEAVAGVGGFFEQFRR